MESLKCRTMSAKNQFQTTPGLHQPSRQIHQFLDYGLDGGGTPHLLLSDYAQMMESIRNADGTWTTSNVPLGGGDGTAGGANFRQPGPVRNGLAQWPPLVSFCPSSNGMRGSIPIARRVCAQEMRTLSRSTRKCEMPPFG